MTSETNADSGGAIFQIIHANREPGVINDAMLRKMIAEQGHTGEAGRLAQLNLVDYATVTYMRLEFQNLLRIDHLWVLPNLQKLSLKFNRIDRIENLHMLTALTELDLSFNCLERIENLDKLVRLEVLTLFGNRITRLENLDTLSAMLILSVGNNRIDTSDGIDRLRFMKELRSLNLEGNPIAEQPAKNGTFSTYIAAILPTLKYYNYKHIMDDERLAGQTEFQAELRQLENSQLAEVKERERIASELADEQRLSSSFVELLNGHQLFDSFFVDDEDGNTLVSIGEDAANLVKEYRTEVYQLTQQIYKLGLDKQELRLTEISMFETCVNDAKVAAQQKGIDMINKFLQTESEMCDHHKELFRQLFDETISGQTVDKLEQAIKMHHDKFMGMIETTWFTLMEAEALLFESIEEANTQFGHTITEMLNTFIEQSQGLFVQMRDAASNFSDAIFEVAARFIAEQAAASNADAVPQQLKPCLEDKDALANMITGSRDVHMQVIDMREDRLVTRARSWSAELIAALLSNEIKRNRNKVMEINYFLDGQRELFDRIREDVENELDA